MKFREWWAMPRIPLSETWKLRLAWFSLVISFIGLPITLVALPEEPPMILTLSWLAISYTAWDIISTADAGAGK